MGGGQSEPRNCLVTQHKLCIHRVTLSALASPPTDDKRADIGADRQLMAATKSHCCLAEEEEEKCWILLAALCNISAFHSTQIRRGFVNILKVKLNPAIQSERDE